MANDLVSYVNPDVIKWDRTPIDRDGIYAMPLESYHESCCIGPSISSSGLRTIEMKCPAKYWCDSPLNPERVISTKQKKHYSIGAAVHFMMAGEHGFKKKFAVRPEKWADWKTQASQAWQAERIREGFYVLEPRDIDTIHGIARSMERDPLIRQGVFSGEAEQSLIWKDPETGIWLKSRPDTRQHAAAVIADLKTTESADHHGCMTAIWNYGYHMQMALAGMGVKHITGQEIPDLDGYVLVFVEKTPPYCVNVKFVDAEAIWYGRMLIRRALRNFAKCWENKDFPSYADNGSYVGLPTWLNKRYMEEFRIGSLQE